jgi:nitroimidazol reductase NimA-like FMN-containing flavoprotein (pyridoxamine 5'-phosphate oxidase superfamily)
MTSTPDTWMVELAREECEQLLRSSVVGRLGVVSDGRPLVFPVCHVYDGHAVAFPTNVGTKLRAALGWPFVAFEVDGVADGGASGWSVMVLGRAEQVDDPAEHVRLAALRSAPWRTADDHPWIRIVPIEVTGRRITGPS